MKKRIRWTLIACIFLLLLMLKEEGAAASFTPVSRLSANNGPRHPSWRRRISFSSRRSSASSSSAHLANSVVDSEGSPANQEEEEEGNEAFQSSSLSSTAQRRYHPSCSPNSSNMQIPPPPSSSRTQAFLAGVAAAAAIAAVMTLPILSPAQAIDHPIDHTILGIPIPVPDGRYFLSGGLCAAASHGVTTPLDVVKTRIQAEPDLFDGKGLVQSSRLIVEEDGVNALLGGLGPTVVGYGVEGAAKFGLYESLKPTFAAMLMSVGDNDPSIPYLGASVVAGACASLMLCPLEQTRIRLVTDPTFADLGLFSGLSRLVEEEGLLPSIFGGFTAMLSKQVPYTICKQVSFDVFAGMLYAAAAAASFAQADVKAEVSVGAAFIASILACVASHPGDVVLTATYKSHDTSTGATGATDDGEDDDDLHHPRHQTLPGFTSVVSSIYSDKGARGFFRGLQARFFHVAAIITSQLVLYDSVKQLLGLPATGTN